MKHADTSARNQGICVEYARGECVRSIAARYGVCAAHVYFIARTGGTPRGRKQTLGEARDARAEAWIEAYKSGKTLHEIGSEYGVSRERVRQIIARFGVTRIDGGATIRRFKATPDRQQRQKERQEGIEARHFANWGVSRQVMASLSDLPRSHRQHPIGKFRRHRQNAKNRGIEWGLTFREWWDIWQESGKWDERGRGGYVMARFGDTGPYAKDNVEIVTSSQNIKDSYITKPQSMRIAKRKSHNATPEATI